MREHSSTQCCSPLHFSIVYKMVISTAQKRQSQTRESWSRSLLQYSWGQSYSIYHENNLSLHYSHKGNEMKDDIFWTLINFESISWKPYWQIVIWKTRTHITLYAVVLFKLHNNLNLPDVIIIFIPSLTIAFVCFTYWRSYIVVERSSDYNL